LGAGKVMEIDGNKCGKRKYHTSHSMKGQWVFKKAVTVTVDENSTSIYTAF